MKNTLKNINLLYVEDDKEISEEILDILELEIDNIHYAANGQDGLELFKKNDIDLVISDIMMPVMNGLEMSRKIREIDSSAIIIITSAFSEVSYFQKAIEIGVDSYILKPVNVKKLLDVIEKSALKLLQQKQIKEYVMLSEMLMDTTPNLIFTISNNHIEFKNKSLLNKLNIDEKNSDNLCLCDYILNIDGSKKFKNRQDMLLHFQKKHNQAVVYIRKDINNPQSSLNAYSVSDIYFETSNKHLIVFTDITEIHNEKERYKLDSFTDKLTNLKNKNYFNIILSEMLNNAKADNRYKLSLIIFDIDFFKKVNDTHGHQVGDNILKSLAQLVQEILRDDDLFARWGGEEFVILCNSDKNGAIALAQKLRTQIELFKFETIGKLTCSFGVAEFCKNDNESSFLNRADKALYNAKNSGRNRVEYTECKEEKV